ncbi:MAG: DUF1987 domain-containing protein [Chlorobi bacterium]|nr:DUF1987 domain-containing protein [Chlorobiota bacterium]
MFIIDKTKNTPFVKISVKDGIFEIIGDSNGFFVNDLYDTALQELERQFSDFNDRLVCRFHYGIFNSDSLKKLIRILIFLNNQYKSGKDITVKWVVNEDDIDNEITGNDLSEIFNIPFEVVKKEKE